METFLPYLLTLLLVAIFHTLPPLTSSFPISPDFPAVFNFGDSNSDTGELSSGLGFRLQPSYGQSYFFKPPSSGRFCNGRLIVDFLMEAIDRPYLRPYLDSVSTQSYRRGCNFAAGGSTVQKANAASISPFDEDLQKYLPSEYYFKSGLYMFDIGQNDLAGAFYQKTLDQVVGLIPTIIDIFQDGIKRLYAEGARNFWIHNTGPLGCIAQVVSLFGRDKSKLDEFGCVSDHNQAAKLFNSQLHGLFIKLPQQYPDSRFTYVDIFSIKSDLILNHSKYGFNHSIMVCCGTGGPPLNYNDQVNCGSTGKSSDGTIITARACNDSSKYVNWDGIHYTEAANRFVALHILSGRYSETALS
ncbi:hypothetical protein Bca101_074221 [Brassica carinata]